MAVMTATSKPSPVTTAPETASVSPASGALATFIADVRPHWPADSALLLSTLPAGGLLVCRRIGSRLTDGDERAAWLALRDGHFKDATRLAVRVEGPIFGGYPGVVVLKGDALTNPIAPDAADQVRQAYGKRFVVRPEVPVRQAVFVNGQPVLPADLDATFGPAIASGLRTAAASASSDDGRQTFLDADGVCVAVQVSHRDGTAMLGQSAEAGPAVFVSLTPRAADWADLQPADFEADVELSRLASAVTFVAEHFRRGPTLGEIAGVVGLSPFHFHRRFTERFGLTPKHLLYDLQLDEAERLLSDPARSLTEIADACGFAHQSHFTSRFKQGTGMTPTAWRRRQRTA